MPPACVCEPCDRLGVVEVHNETAAPGRNADVGFWLVSPPIANDCMIARRFLDPVQHKRTERNLAAWLQRENRKTAVSPFESGVNHGSPPATGPDRCRKLEAHDAG
jgi:hypothetical protein